MSVMLESEISKDRTMSLGLTDEAKRIGWRVLSGI